MIRYILASASPRRRELLEQAGFAFEVIPARGEEQAVSTDPARMVEELSSHKAEEIAALAAKEPVQAGTDTIIIGSDTVVAADGVVLGKPADRADAIAMITDLQGRIHQVYTGVTLIRLRADGSRDRRIFHECTDVEVYPMTEQEIAAYADTEEPYDKAGAYGIQGAFGVRYVSGIRGDYYNVVGLPVPRLCQELKAMLG